MVTREQIERYRTDGLLVIDDVLSVDQIEHGGRIVDAFIEHSRDVASSNDVYDLEPGHSAARPMIRRLKSPVRLDPFFDQLIRSTPIVERLEGPIGQSVRMLGSKLNMKAADGGSPVEWHQDVAFHPHTNDDVLALGVYFEMPPWTTGAC